MSSADDDTYIISVGRAAQARGERVQCHGTEAVEDGFKVAVSLFGISGKRIGKQTVTVKLAKEIAHGRRLALEAIQRGRNDAAPR
jgi:hypothetical protein